MQLKRAKRTEYENGFLNGNADKEICLYDKNMEIFEKNGIIQKDISGTTLRAESRFLKGRSVERYLGTNAETFFSKSDGYLKDQYRNFIKNDFFRIPEKDNQLLFVNFESEVEELKYLKALHSRGAIGKYVQRKGYKEIFQAFGGIELFKRALIEAGFSRMSAYEWEQTLRKEFNSTQYLDVSGMYRELYEKLVS
jgi:hypothetical protein